LSASIAAFAAIGAVMLLGLVARRWRGDIVAPIARLERTLVAVVVLATAAVTVWVNHGLARPPVIHDEAAYLLQARLLATGRLSAPSPPAPEFFEQYHVLVEPRLAPKYFPGHAALLAPGAALGSPGLGPLLLGALAGGLLFGFARALAGTWVALLAWAIWLTAPGAILLRWSYLSQLSTTPAWLGAGWFLWRWWRNGRLREAAGVGALAGLLAITRPYTALALGLPIGVLLVAGAWRRRDARSLLVAAATAAPFVALLPVWNVATTGSFAVTPYERYREEYMPWDRLGFGAEARPPERALPPDMIAFGRAGTEMHARHRTSLLPRELAGRLSNIARDLCAERGWRVALLPFLLVGLCTLPPPARCGLVAGATLVGAHLLYAHPAGWGFYYAELSGFLAFAAAVGVAIVLEWLTRSESGRNAALALSALAVTLASLGSLAVARRELWHQSDAQRRFAGLLEELPEVPAIVFVRYAAGHRPELALIENPPDHGAARVWRVYDRGPDNERLLRAAPGRVPYLFDEASGRLAPLDELAAREADVARPAPGAPDARP
jgi:hypothetical protein